MDFLGLRNLTILSDALDNIALNRAVQVDLDGSARPWTIRRPMTCSAGATSSGCSSSTHRAIRQLCRLMRPDRFEDISALGALYRPGPMGANSHTNYALRKNGQQEISYLHPELAEALAPILGESWGLIIYQEQVLKIAQQLAGYSLGSADLLRKAMGKKKKEVLDAEYVTFEQGMIANGSPPGSIKALWDVLVPFSNYAFNKAHSAAYGLVSYWTAYLKAHYPAEYMAAVLTSIKDDKDKMAIYLAECRRMGIKVLPPDVNESEANFTPVGPDIRFGLTAVRNVGANVVDGIVAAREEHGKAADFHGFLDQVPLVVCNKRVIESLIKAGAFESMGHTRRALMTVYEAAVDGVLDLKRNSANGQDGFDFGFGEDDSTAVALTGTVPDIDDWDKRTKLAFEREMLGLYVSDHPLQGLEHVLHRERDLGIGELIGADDSGEARPGGGRDNNMVTIAGMITNVTRKTTKRGDIWAVISVEDLEASVEVLLFPKAYDLVSTVLATDVVVRVKGKVRVDDDGVAMIGQELTLPDVSDRPNGPVVISLPAVRCTPPVVEQLRSVLQAHPGMTEVRLKLLTNDKTTLMRLDQQLRVTASQPLMADLKALLGPSCLAS